MSDAALDRLRSAGEAFTIDLARERYRVQAGLTGGIDLAAVHARHPRVTGMGALETAREAFAASAEGSVQRRSAGKLLEWQIETQVAQALAPLDEQMLTVESHAVVRLDDGRRIPYQRVASELAMAGDRDERLAIDAARCTVVASEIAPLARERLTRERDVVESFGVADGYLGTIEAASGISLRALAAECEAFLRETAPMWDDVLPTFLKRAGIARRDARRADAFALVRATAFDDAFPGREMEHAVRRQLAEAMIWPDARGRIHFDLADREGKPSGACCVPVRVPDEIHLLARPAGGVRHWRSFLHETGHALHFANVDASLAFEDRVLGDSSVTEGYAMLFDHLLHDRDWLARYSQLPTHRLRDYLAQAAFEELHALRRSAAKLLYELELHAGELSWDSLPERYVDRMTAATGFQYLECDAVIDVGPRFAAARSLRAWQLQGALAERLRERFDEDWFRNPAGGAYLVGELMAEGQQLDAAELLEREGGGALSFDAVIRAVEARLA